MTNHNDALDRAIFDLTRPEGQKRGRHRRDRATNRQAATSHACLDRKERCTDIYRIAKSLVSGFPRLGESN
jgi:hypothetical protein